MVMMAVVMVAVVMIMAVIMTATAGIRGNTVGGWRFLIHRVLSVTG